LWVRTSIREDDDHRAGVDRERHRGGRAAQALVAVGSGAGLQTHPHPSWADLALCVCTVYGAVVISLFDLNTFYPVSPPFWLPSPSWR